MTKIRKWTASLLAIALCLTLLAVPAMAYERVDTSAKTSLELNYNDEDRTLPLSGMGLRIYKVCTMTDAVSFAFTDDFTGASVAITSDMNAAKWAAMADTLAAYVNTHTEIVPTDTKNTDSNGSAKFTDLSVGLYLVTGSSVTLSGYQYTPTSFLLTLPNLNVSQEGETWQYDVVAENKFTRKKLGDGPSTISRNVMKVWADEEGDARPSSVTVSLLRDGRVYDTVTLDEKNNWKHSWISLNENSTWTLAETNVPSGYTVLVEQTGNTFVVTNTQTSIIEPPDVPLGPPEPPEVEIPDEGVPTDGRLPQTGILWWPVQVLALVGILLFTFGWIERKRRKKSSNAS